MERIQANFLILARSSDKGNTLKFSHPLNLYTSRAFGAVYMGIHKESGAVLAVKSCPNLGPQKASISKEINILKKCKHKNIVQYYGSCEKGKEFWVRAIKFFSSFLCLSWMNERF